MFFEEAQVAVGALDVSRLDAFAPRPPANGVADLSIQGPRRAGR